MSRKILIGVIITECHMAFHEEILRGIIAQSFRNKCDIAVIAPMHNFFIKSTHRNAEKNIFKLILSESFDGFLYDRNSFHDDETKQHIDNLLTRSGKPVMLLDSNDHKSFENTPVDDCDAFETITDHLIDVHGFRKIYCITGPKNNYISEERLNGYMNSMKKHKLSFDKSFFRYGDFWTEAAKDFAHQIISGSVERPEAIVCGNDVMAISMTKTLMSNGIKVPEDIAVTGCDASTEGYQFSPSITSYRRPNFQLGAESLRRLYRIITGKICKKVPNENGALRLGASCGCTESPEERHDLQKKSRINSTFESTMLYGDMLFDITNTDNIDAFADKLDNYTYILHKMNRLKLCLTRRYIDSTTGSDVNLSFEAGDEMKTVLSKASSGRDYSDLISFSSNDVLPAFSEERRYSSAYYISPLHYNDNFFGYSAVSFGKEPISFNTLYIQWLNYVNAALEQLRIKSMINSSMASYKTSPQKHSGIILNQSGICQAFEGFLSSAENSTPVCCISLELFISSASNASVSDEQRHKTIAELAEIFKSCILENEICGSWSPGIFCILTKNENRAHEIFSQIRTGFQNARFSHDENIRIDFIIGQYTIPSDEEKDIADAVYMATVNKLYTYTISDNSNENPQLEKLCTLRSRIMKNPELPWNIGEIAESLYLSKSYLQKIYKALFGRSIIEEMIFFRISNAKRLLSKTDMTVTDISRECGYASYNYFVRQFKESEGISPSDYRTLHKKA